MNWFRLRWIEQDELLEPETDARRADDRAGEPEQDLENQRLTRFRRRAVVFALATVFVGGMLAALFGKGGYHELHGLRSEAGRLEVEVAGLKLDVDLLQREMLSLEEDPAAREKIAREQLGFVLPGEIDLLLPRAPSPEAVEEVPGGDDRAAPGGP